MAAVDGFAKLLDRVAFLAQAGADAGTNHRIVLNHQESHYGLRLIFRVANEV